ncbi:MAG TPA: ATPase [Firmicutes bacterium]|nr:ATPase [Bacillota bacterium]
MTYFLGVAGGGLRTICYLANDKGELLGRGEAGASLHYDTNGLERALAEIQISIERAIATSGREVREIAAACFGLAGIDSGSDYNRVYDSLTKSSAAHSILLENDAVIALLGGNAEPYGVVLISGVGAIAFGINRRGERRRAGGWGHRMGDEGSGYDIAVTAIKAALKAHDGREEPTLLVPFLQQRLGRAGMEEVVQDVRDNLGRVEIAALAGLVFRAAQERDRVAQRILIRAGDELGRTINAVISGLALNDEEISIPLVGQVFEHEGREFLIDVIKEKVLYAAPRAQIVQPKFEPAIGAVICALRHAGLPLDQHILGNLRRSQAEFVQPRSYLV